VVKSEIEQRMGKMRMKCSGWKDVADSRRGGGGLVPNGRESRETSEQGARGSVEILALHQVGP